MSASAPFRGRSFLAVAHGLLNLPSCAEPEQRTAIGRAYYACFFEARDYLETRRPTVPTDSTVHGFVISEMDRLDAAISQGLRRLRRMRNSADYDQYPQGTNISKAANLALTMAQGVVNDIDQLP